MTIAQTIIQQLGGNKFLAMTGAKSLVDTGEGLQFKLPARLAKSGINCVTIKLNARDLYDITYYKTRGLDLKVMGESSDIYADSLQASFTEATGLETSL